MKFSKVEDKRHTLWVALIPIYKRSTHEKKKGESSLREKLQRQTKEKN